jgi:hypothetical protein
MLETFVQIKTIDRYKLNLDDCKPYQPRGYFCGAMEPYFSNLKHFFVQNTISS